MAGAAAGGPVGMPSRGARLGKSIGAKISKLVGSGDYEVFDGPSVNALVKSPSGGGGGNGYASFGNERQSTSVKHREYLQDVLSGPVAGAFSTTQFAINPGLVTTFPYLAQIASNFEEYRFKGLAFEFVSTTSPFNANSAMGSTIIAMEYNAAAPAFTNKPQMENSDFAISARFDKNIMYGVECASNAQNSYYVRQGGSTLPLPMTDLGTLFVATAPSTTFPVNSVIGELWVTYDVDFYRPRVTNARYGYYHASSPTTTGLGWNPLVPGFIKSVSYGTMSGAAVTAVGNNSTVTFPSLDMGDVVMMVWYATGWTAANTGVVVAKSTDATGTDTATPIFGLTPVGFTPTNVLSSMAGGVYNTNADWGGFSNLIGNGIGNSLMRQCAKFAFYTVTAASPSVTFTGTGVSSGGGAIGFDFIAVDVSNGIPSTLL